MNTRERELETKGYRYGYSFDYHHDEAKAKAKELREQGYYACVVRYSTNVIGLTDYVVWYKKKGE